jgi:integrase
VANIQEYKAASGKRFVARIRVRGFRPTSQAFPTRAEAQEWASGLEKQLRAERARTGLGVRSDASAITLRELVERFLADPVVRQTKYFPELSLLLATWVNEYGGVKVRAFGRIHVETMRDTLLAKRLRTAQRPTKKKKPADGAEARPKAPKTMSAARVNRYVAAMRRAWNWGQVKGYVLTSLPWPAEVMLPEPKPRAVFAEPEQIREVFAACDAVAPQLGTLVRFLVGTGCRLGDALAVTWRDVSEADGDVAVRGQKTGNPMRVAMLAPAREALERAKRVRDLSGRVFWQYKSLSSPQWHWRLARASFPAPLRDWRLHDCRHLCAGLLAAGGATAVELAAQLGHSSLAMVQRYAHLRGGHRGAAHDKVDAAFG